MSREAKKRRPAPGRPARAAAPAPALERAWPWVLAAVFAAAWAWRALYLARLAQTPLADSRVADAHTYWNWASSLLAHGMAGRHPFFQGPLYPYTLAVLRAALGDSSARVLQVQALWGAGAAALLADAARRLVNPAVGLVVGLAVAFGAMATFFDGLVLGESLLFALACLLLWCVARTRQRPASLADVAGWGALIGLMAEGRATCASLLAPAALLAWEARATGGAAAPRLAALALAFTVVAAPAAVHNLRASGEWIPFTYNSGFNLYVGNHDAARGTFLVPAGVDFSGATIDDDDGAIAGDGRNYAYSITGRHLGPNESSAWWSARARAWMVAHPGTAARLWARKVVLLWSRHEYPQIENADEFRLFAGPLGLPWLGGLALLGALALGGLAIAWRDGPAGRFVAGYVIVGTAVLLPFFVTDRYRHQLAPGALLAAAFALGALARVRREPALARRLAPGAALGLALALWPAPHLSAPRYAWGLAVDMGGRWLERERPDLALPYYERALAIDHSKAIGWVADATDSLSRGLFLHNYARALTGAGREADALQAHERAAQLVPGSVVIREGLAAALGAAGDQARSAALFARSGHAHAGADALLARAWAAARAGDLPAAERAFASVTQADPGNGDAWGALVRLQLQQQRTADADTTLRRALAAGWRGPEAVAHQALVAASEGRRADARRLMATLPPDALAHDPVLADVARVIAGLLGPPPPR